MAVQTNPSTLPDFGAEFNVQNRNFLSPIGFKFVIKKMSGVDFFCQAAKIPSISMQKVRHSTSVNQIPQPGDELYYEDFSLRFLVDENMKNWYQVHDWMREITTPYSAKEFGYSRGTLESKNPVTRRVKPIPGLVNNQWRSEASLFVLSSNYQPVAEFVFHDMFPISLSPVLFDSSVPDIEYMMCDCSLAYSYFDYFIYNASTVTDSSMKSTLRISQEGINLNES